MGREEQKEEREVLDAIFPDEITDISELEYRLSIALEEPNEEDAEATRDAPILLLRVSYPQDYPDVGPDLEISAPPNAPKHKFLNAQDDKAYLLESLQPVIEENIGMAMVFTLVSTLKDNAELLMADRRGAEQAIKDREAAKIEAEENKKFHGTAVTRETFLEWRSNFKKEMEELERRRLEEKELDDKKKRIPKEEHKLTGKELWDRGMAGKGGESDDEEEEGEETRLDAVENLTIES